MPTSTPIVPALVECMDPSSSIDILPPIRSRRTITRPSHLSDYVCLTLQPESIMLASMSQYPTSMIHPLTNFLSYHHLSPKHFAFLSTLNNHHDPYSYSEAACRPH